MILAENFEIVIKNTPFLQAYTHNQSDMLTCAKIILLNTKSVSGRHKTMYLPYFTSNSPWFSRRILKLWLKNTPFHPTYIHNQSSMLTCTNIILLHTKSVSERHKTVFLHYFTFNSQWFSRRLLKQFLHTTSLTKQLIWYANLHQNHPLQYKKGIRRSQNRVCAHFYI